MVRMSCIKHNGKKGIQQAAPMPSLAKEIALLFRMY